MHIFMCIYVCLHAYIKLCIYVCVQSHRSTDAQTHRHNDTQTHRHTDIQSEHVGSSCLWPPIAQHGSRPQLLAMAIRGIFQFEEILDAKLSGCQALCLRPRAQAMRRSHSDSSLAGWYDCRDQHCSCMLGPLDSLSFDGKNDRLIYISSERTCPVCGTTTSTHSRAFYAYLSLLRDGKGCGGDRASRHCVVLK